MQAENETFLDFLRRTDVLALALGKNVQDLPDILDFSRASLFSYRTGKRPITSKAWRKLEHAERSAGIASKEEQLKAAVREEAINAIPEQGREAMRRLFEETKIRRVVGRLSKYFFDSNALAKVVVELLKSPQSKKTRESAMLLAKRIMSETDFVRAQTDPIFEEMINSIYNESSGAK